MSTRELTTNNVLPVKDIVMQLLKSLETAVDEATATAATSDNSFMMTNSTSTNNNTTTSSSSSTGTKVSPLLSQNTPPSTESILLGLNFFFPTILSAALDLIDRRKVTKVILSPSQRHHYQVRLNSKTTSLQTKQSEEKKKSAKFFQPHSILHSSHSVISHT